MTFNANPTRIHPTASRGSPELSYFGAARALSVAPVALDWLAHTCIPRWLHIFERACNLINEYGEILSIVAPDIDNGPFNIVIAEPYPSFVGNCDARTPITIDRKQLVLGGTAVDLRDASVWFPRPNWQRLHQHRAGIAARLLDLQAWIQEQAKPDSLLRGPFVPSRDRSALPADPLRFWAGPLCMAVANGDPAGLTAIARRVAGLGAGLTPAGDDLLLGAMYAAWVLHPAELAGAVASAMAEAACPRTTSLSGAWLGAGSRGEASMVWHHFLRALLAADMAMVRASTQKLLAVGHTSGADALAGFIGTLICRPSA